MIAGDVRWSGPQNSPAEFLGRRYTFSNTWVKLAAMTGAPVVPVFCRIDDDGAYRLEFQEPYSIPRDETGPDQVGRLGQRFLRTIEAQVERYPANSNEYLFWASPGADRRPPRSRPPRRRVSALSPRPGTGKPRRAGGQGRPRAGREGVSRWRTDRIDAPDDGDGGAVLALAPAGLDGRAGRLARGPSSPTTSTANSPASSARRSARTPRPPTGSPSRATRSTGSRFTSRRWPIVLSLGRACARDRRRPWLRGAGALAGGVLVRREPLARPSTAGTASPGGRSSTPPPRRQRVAPGAGGRRAAARRLVVSGRRFRPCGLGGPLARGTGARGRRACSLAAALTRSSARSRSRASSRSGTGRAGRSSGHSSRSPSALSGSSRPRRSARRGRSACLPAAAASAAWFAVVVGGGRADLVSPADRPPQGGGPGPDLHVARCRRRGAWRSPTAGTTSRRSSTSSPKTPRTAARGSPRSLRFAETHGCAITAARPTSRRRTSSST